MPEHSPVGPISERFRGAAAAWAHGQYLIVVTAAEFADSPEWVLAGSPTAAHWLADAADVEACTTREWIRIGRRLRELPLIDDAFRGGGLSYSKVRSLTRIVTAETEAELFEIAMAASADSLSRELASWATRNTDPEELAERQHRWRSIRWRIEPDGMTLFTLRLPPLLASMLIAALTKLTMSAGKRTQRGRNASADAWPSVAQQHADSLEELLTSGAGAIDTEIIIHVRGDGCSLDDGTPIPASVVEHIAPTSFLRALVHDADSKPINASGRQRHPTTRQKRVVKETDRCCVDCGRTVLLEYDHDPPYQKSRHTVVGEIRLRCSTCHHKRHLRESAKIVNRAIADGPQGEA